MDQLVMHRSGLYVPQNAIGPSIIGLGRKSHNNPSAEDACIEAAVQAHRGCDFLQPVIFDRQIVGTVEGYRNDPRVTFTRTNRRIWAAGYATYDDLIAGLTAGKRLGCFFTKTFTTAPIANNWYDLWTNGGAPTAGAFTGSAFTARQFDDTTTGSLFTGGNVSTATKHILSAWGLSTGGTPTLVIYDRVLAYEACTYNAAANQAMTNTLTAQRYVSAGQSGMKVVCTVQTVNGATATNLTQLRYTNQAGTTLQVMPTSPTVSFIVSGAAPTSTLGARVIAPATTAATLPWGPYLPFAAGDGGARLINDYTTSVVNTGTITFILSRPLFHVGLATAGVVSQIDGIYQIASLERIYDGACIALMAYTPAATATTLQGNIDVGWN